jgi:hypothetical protein
LVAGQLVDCLRQVHERESYKLNYSLDSIAAVICNYCE